MIDSKKIIDLRKNDDLQNIANTVQKWLQEKDDWKARFEEYATGIKAQEENIISIRKNFHKAKNLNLYTSIGYIKSKKGINLRYKGQSIAYLKLKQGKLMLYTNKDLDISNKRYLGWSKPLNCPWDSSEAAEFRKHFSQNLPKENNIEHIFESALIENMSKTSSKDKKLCNIQPVRIYDELAFQMTTVLSGSGKTICLSERARAGGIDILARVKQGGNTNLCVIELKKDAVKTAKQAHIIRGQGLGYAVFLRELLRSPSGAKWFEHFGYKQKLPQSLVINVCIAAPAGKYCISEEPKDVYLGQDILRFKYIMFEANNEAIKSIHTDLFDGNFK